MQVISWLAVTSQTASVWLRYHFWEPSRLLALQAHRRPGFLPRSHPPYKDYHISRRRKSVGNQHLPHQPYLIKSTLSPPRPSTLLTVPVSSEHSVVLPPIVSLSHSMYISHSRQYLALYHHLCRSMFRYLSLARCRALSRGR